MNCKLVLLSVVSQIWTLATEQTGFGAESAALEWERSVGRAEGFASAVEPTRDGGFVVTGSQSAGRDGGGAEIFLLKADAEGDILWERGFGEGHGASVEQTTDGGYIVAGSIRVTADADIVLIKTDENGSLGWRKVFDQPQARDFAFSVRQTSGGGYLVAGETGRTGSDVDAYLIRTDSEGELLWKRTFGTPERHDAAYSLWPTRDGGYVIAGETALLREIGLHPSDVYLVKTNGEGLLVWERQFGTAEGHEVAYSVQETHDGGYVLAGSSLIRTDSEGRALWERPFEAFSIDATADGGYVLAGASLIKTGDDGSLLWERRLPLGRSVQETADGSYIVAGENRPGGYSGPVAGYLAKFKRPTDGVQMPGDCNQDGALDISDAICLLGHLFLGMPATVPCHGGTIQDPSNIALLDSNGGGGIDLSDAVYVLGYLFGGSGPPVLGAVCVPIAGCPDNSELESTRSRVS